MNPNTTPETLLKASTSALVLWNTQYKALQTAHQLQTVLLMQQLRGAVAKQVGILTPLADLKNATFESPISSDLLLIERGIFERARTHLIYQAPEPQDTYWNNDTTLRILPPSLAGLLVPPSLWTLNAFAQRGSVSRVLMGGERIGTAVRTALRELVPVWNEQYRQLIVEKNTLNGSKETISSEPAQEGPKTTSAEDSTPSTPPKVRP